MADGHEIPLSEAAAMTAAWRNSASFATFNERKALAFNKEAIERLLNQEGCVGLRSYLALDEKNQITLVVAAYDNEGNDILRELAEKANPCPTFCGTLNELNS